MVLVKWDRLTLIHDTIVSPAAVQCRILCILQLRREFGQSSESRDRLSLVLSAVLLHDPDNDRSVGKR